MDAIEGTILSKVSRGAKSRKKNGRKKAIVTAATAFIPGVSEKTSINRAKQKAHNITVFLDISDSNLRIRYIYKKGVAYPAICILFNISTCKSIKPTNHPALRK